MEYRPDIDGLRTLAIVPVVFFHAGISSFSGGYVGVDIFFVISGFLIGGIIIDAHNDKAFSYIKFYERRARRLLPALFTVVTITLIAGYFLLIPGDYKDLFESARYTTLFVSNFFFMNATDYFNQKSEFMPLLHTWSLAIEEQFYIIWPFFIALYVKITNKISNNFGFLFILSILVLSLIAATISIRINPTMTFYMTPFRLWELSLGTLVAITMRLWPDLIRTRSVKLFPPWLFYSTGLILCIGSVIRLTPESTFPALNAVPVCIGTALLLLFGDSKPNPASWLFRQPPLVFIGKVSYSWYLWHWILLAYFRVYQESIKLSQNQAYWCIVLSLLLAIITWYFIENPMRFKASKSLIFKFSAGACLLLFGVSSVGISSNGLASRFTMDLDYIKSRGEMWQWASTRRDIIGLGENVKFFGAAWDTADYKVLLWGDSHAAHIAPILEYVADKKGVAVLFWGSSPPFIDNITVRRFVKGSTRGSERKGARHKKIMEWLSKPNNNVDEIILSSAWSGYRIELFNDDIPLNLETDNGAELIGIGMKALLNQLNMELGDIPITILTDVPRPGKRLITCAYRSEQNIIPLRDPQLCSPLERRAIENWHAPSTMILKQVASEHTNVGVIDLVERMCDDDSCPIFIEERVLYRDHNHIRRNLLPAEKKKLVDLMGLKFRGLPENEQSRIFDLATKNSDTQKTSKQ